jgi:O-antigen ligase
LTTLAAQSPRRAYDVKIPTLKFRVTLVAGSLLVGLAAGYLGTTGHATRMVALAVILLPVWLWKRPHLGPAVLVGAAIMFEQSPMSIIPFTGKVPMFEGVGPGHLQGADMLILLIFAIYALKGKQLSGGWRPRSHVSTALICVAGCVLYGIFMGHHHSGSLREAFMEARPYVYLIASYFLTSVLITNRKALESVLWSFVLTVSFKAVQGLYVYVKTRHDYPRPESIIGHEASYFFVAYIVLVLGLWLFNESSRLRKTATRLLPLVIACALVNDRRAAWEMLGGALLTFMVIAYHTAPMRRRLLGRSIVAMLLISAVYFPVMWDKSDSLAQPARAIRSQVTPSARDASSDIYRVQENANLEHNIQMGGFAGRGFGVKINYSLPITDISPLDPLITYIPHNDVLYIMVRMGILGGIAVWSLIGVGIIGGARLARAPDRLVATIGMLAACSLVAYALMGAVDQGFFWYRLAFVTGTLLGLAEAAQRIQLTQLSPVRRPVRAPAPITVMLKMRRAR